MEKEKDGKNTIIHSEKKQMIWAPPGPSINDRPESFHLSTNRSYPGVGWKKSGYVQQVTSATWPILQGIGITTFIYEFFEESMRIVHWHNFCEVVSVYFFFLYAN